MQIVWLTFQEIKCPPFTHKLYTFRPKFLLFHFGKIDKVRTCYCFTKKNQPKSYFCHSWGDVFKLYAKLPLLFQLFNDPSITKKAPKLPFHLQVTLQLPLLPKSTIKKRSKWALLATWNDTTNNILTDPECEEAKAELFPSHKGH